MHFAWRATVTPIDRAAIDLWFDYRNQTRYSIRRGPGRDGRQQVAIWRTNNSSITSFDLEPIYTLRAAPVRREVHEPVDWQGTVPQRADLAEAILLDFLGLKACMPAVDRFSDVLLTGRHEQQVLEITGQEIDALIEPILPRGAQLELMLWETEGSLFEQLQRPDAPAVLQDVTTMETLLAMLDELLGKWTTPGVRFDLELFVRDSRQLAAT